MAVARPRITILLTLLIFISSCGDDSPTGPGVGKIDVNFPNAIGMLWKYQVYDSLSQTTDTVWFSITDTITNSSKESFSERSEKHFADNSFGWQYFQIRGDTLEIFDDTIGASANERIVFPLELGSSWTGPVTVGDTSTVTLVGQIDVPAAKFSNAARIDRSWNIDFEGGGNWSQTWVVPDVGVVYRYRRSQFFDGGGGSTVTTNEVWELIEYDLTTFGLHQFPNHVGAEWVYEQIDSNIAGRDSFTVEFDTVTVTIVDSGKFESGDSYAIWEFVSRNRIDTQFVVTGIERLSFLLDTAFFYPSLDIRYEFPLAVGRNWGLEFIASVVPEVLDKESVLTPVQHFASVFHTRMQWAGLNNYSTQEDLLVAGVGIVKSRRRQFGFIPWMNRTRTLIDYRLAN
ncbi:MAG: hypothetical protein IIB00_10990 [candidate division Zixibacteria bacterium]|nr:hypothetical protein [candidate division Zixibacteria bacterium]